MSKQKILVFHHSGAVGGGGVSMMHILKSIDTKKYDIKVYCPYEKGHMINAIKDIGLGTSDEFEKGYVYPHFNGKTYSVLDIRFLRQVSYIRNSKDKIMSILQKEKPDILILNSFTLFWMGKIAKGLGIKTVCFYRETLPRFTPFRNAYIKNQLRKYMDRLCYISEYDRDVVGDNKKSFVIYDRVEDNRYLKRVKEDARKDIGIDNDSKYILFLGGMWRVKGTHVIVKALKGTDAKLVMLQYVPSEKAGKSLKDVAGIKRKIRYIFGMDYEAKVLNYIDKNDLWDRIVFFDGAQDIWAMYDACDVVVFPSTLPHQSRPLYEAGFAKVPFVITDFNNTREFAKDGFNALTFKKGNSHQLAKKINNIFENDNKEMLKNNYKQSNMQHSLSTLKSDIDNMLKGL